LVFFSLSYFTDKDKKKSHNKNKPVSFILSFFFYLSDLRKKKQQIHIQQSEKMMPQTPLISHDSRREAYLQTGWFKMLELAAISVFFIGEILYITKTQLWDMGVFLIFRLFVQTSLIASNVMFRASSAHRITSADKFQEARLTATWHSFIVYYAFNFAMSIAFVANFSITKGAPESPDFAGGHADLYYIYSSLTLVSFIADAIMGAEIFSSACNLFMLAHRDYEPPKEPRAKMETVAFANMGSFEKFFRGTLGFALIYSVLLNLVGFADMAGGGFGKPKNYVIAMSAGMGLTFFVAVLFIIHIVHAKKEKSIGMITAESFATTAAALAYLIVNGILYLAYASSFWRKSYRDEWQQTLKWFCGTDPEPADRDTYLFSVGIFTALGGLVVPLMWNMGANFHHLVAWPMGIAMNTYVSLRSLLGNPDLSYVIGWPFRVLSLLFPFSVAVASILIAVEISGVHYLNDNITTYVVTATVVIGFTGLVNLITHNMLMFHALEHGKALQKSHPTVFEAVSLISDDAKRVGTNLATIGVMILYGVGLGTFRAETSTHPDFSCMGIKSAYYGINTIFVTLAFSTAVHAIIELVKLPITWAKIPEEGASSKRS
jgi:hypothetical protein